MIWRLTYTGLNKDDFMNVLTTQYMAEISKEYPLQYSSGKVFVVAKGNVLEVKTDDPVIADKFKKSLNARAVKIKFAMLRAAGLKSELIE